MGEEPALIPGGAADQLGAAQAEVDDEAKLAATPKPKPRRRKLVPTAALDSAAVSEDEVLLPGASAIESSGASTAE